MGYIPIGQAWIESRPTRVMDKSDNHVKQLLHDPMDNWGQESWILKIIFIIYQIVTPRRTST